MLTERIPRRRFWENSTQAAAGALTTSLAISQCSSQKRMASQIERYDSKRDGGCAVAFGYEMDMPCAGVEYLYDRNLGWPRDGECIANGHLNEDVGTYVRLPASISEDYGLGLQSFVQGNTLEETEDAAPWTEIAGRGHAIDSHVYNHDSLLRTPVEEVRSQLAKTKSLIRFTFSGTSLSGRDRFPGTIRTESRTRPPGPGRARSAAVRRSRFGRSLPPSRTLPFPPSPEAPLRTRIPPGFARSRSASGTLPPGPPAIARYERLVASGKPHKVAAVAVMRGLACLLNTLLRENRLWQAEPPGRGREATA